MRGAGLALGLALTLAGCQGGCGSSAAPPSPSATAARGAPSGSASAAPSPPASAANGSDLAPEKLAAFVNPSGLPPYAGPTGSLEGTVFVTGDAPPPLLEKNYSKCPLATTTRASAFRAGPPDAEGRRPVAGAVVAVTGYRAWVPERQEAKRVILTACEEFPRAITLTLGQRLEIQNKTPIVFAPALVQEPSPALMMVPPGGDAVKIYVKRPGHFDLVDRVAGDFITADVYVLLHPHHAVTTNAGHYRIDGIPVGKLTVGARIGSVGQEVTAPVEITTGVVRTMDLVIPYKAPSTDAGAPHAPPPEGPRGRVKG